MTYVGVMEDAAPAIIKGVPAATFAGRSIHVRRGLDLDPTQLRGYGRSPGNSMDFRPGAHSPHATRRHMGERSDTWVGTRDVSRSERANFNRAYDERGPVGTRHIYQTPPPAGLHRGERVPLSSTPAMRVFQSAVDRTGGFMRLAGTGYSMPGGAIPPGLRAPGAPPPPVGTTWMPAPVAALPGTPGAFSGGALMSWQGTQAHGSMLMASAPQAFSPLPAHGEDAYLYDTPGVYEPQPAMPLDAPGTSHVSSEEGAASYEEAPGTPAYTSPFGYAGGARVEQPATPPSGHDVKPKSGLKVSALIVGGIAALAIAARLGRRTRRRR